MTDWPVTDGLADEVTVVVEACAFTVWVSVVEVDGESVALPRYLATMVSVPAAREGHGTGGHARAVDGLTAPAQPATAVPPSKNSMLPVGVPIDDVACR